MANDMKYAEQRRLIDSDALKAELKKSAEYHEARRLGLFSAMTHIDEQPPVDAVEVVRCKDCESYTDMDAMSGTKLNFRWCGKFRNIMAESDFCSYGKKERQRE